MTNNQDGRFVGVFLNNIINLYTIILCVLFDIELVYINFILLIISVIAVFPPPPADAKITIFRMDLDTLKPETELNDAIVDFFLL